MFWFFWLPGMWDLSFPARDGSNPHAPEVEGEVLTTGLPRSPLFILFHRHSYHFLPPPTHGGKSPVLWRCWQHPPLWMVQFPSCSVSVWGSQVPLGLPFWMSVVWQPSSSFPPSFLTWPSFLFSLGEGRGWFLTCLWSLAFWPAVQGGFWAGRLRWRWWLLLAAEERRCVSSDSKEHVGSGLKMILTVGKESVKSGLCFPKKLQDTRDLTGFPCFTGRAFLCRYQGNPQFCMEKKTSKVKWKRRQGGTRDVAQSSEIPDITEDKELQT